MQTHDITPEQRNRAAHRKERRHQKAARRAEELLRQIEFLRRQFADALRRRQRILPLLPLAILKRALKLRHDNIPSLAERRS